MVFQHPESTFDPRWKMLQSLTEPFRLTGRVPSQADLVEMLEAVELNRSLLDRRPGELSGGELQRVAIARALAMCSPHFSFWTNPRPCWTHSPRRASSVC
jgi:peptide/nickel transport system ATP-binding protein